MNSFKIGTRKKKSSTVIKLVRGKDISLSVSSQGPLEVVVELPASSVVEEFARVAGKQCAVLTAAMQQHELFVATDEMSAQEVEQFLEGLLFGSLTDEWSSSGVFAYSGRAMAVSVLPQNLDRQHRKHLETLFDTVQYARKLVATPPNLMGPEEFCHDVQQKLSESRATIRIRDEKWLKKKGFGLLLSVGKSGRASRLLEITVPARKKNASRVLIVGKGVTFDSGGLDLKPPAGMLKMKYDMAGGAAAASMAIYALEHAHDVELKILVPLVENLVNLEASRPSDVYVAYNKKTVEITNTDAEGRLILADSIAYGIQDFQPHYIVDIATLTGAATMVAGWNIVNTCTDPEFAAEYRNAALLSGERAIELPLWPEYQQEYKSSVADLKNATNTRNAGTIAAAAFLQNFVADNRKWLHLDIAAAAWNSKTSLPRPDGPTGAGVRSLAYWLRNLDAEEGS
jgi:leucyl aminopeptidase